MQRDASGPLRQTKAALSCHELNIHEFSYEKQIRLHYRHSRFVLRSLRCCLRRQERENSVVGYCTSR